MGDMSWLSHLVTNGSRKDLEDFLKDKKFKRPKFAAEQFLQAQKEIEQKSIDKMNDVIKSTEEYKIGKKLLEGDIANITGDKDTDALLEDERIAQESEPTTADKYNKEWLNEKGTKS